MSTTSTISLFWSRVPSWRLVLLLLLFVWLPLAGLVVTLGHLLDGLESGQQIRMGRHLDILLDEAVTFDDEQDFWTRVLQRVEARGANHPEGMEFLQREVGRMRRWFPAGDFKLVMWDAEGRLLHADAIASFSVSDWSLIRDEIVQNAKRQPKGGPTESTTMISPLWQRLFGGGLFTSRELRFWLKNQRFAKPLGLNNPPGLWWGKVSRVSYLLYVRPAAFGEPMGLRHFHDYPPLWRFPGIRFGFFDPRRPTHSLPGSAFLEELFAERSPMQALSVPRPVHPRWFVASRRLPSGRVACAAIPKSWFLIHRQTMMLGLSFLLLGLAGFLTRWTKRRWNGEDRQPLSLRWKLGFLFLIANGLPLAMLSVVGMDQLRNKEISLLNDLQQSCGELIRRFDEGVSVHVERTRRAALQRLEPLAAKLAERPFTAQDFPALFRDMKDLGVGQFLLCASDSYDWVSSEGYFPEKGRSIHLGRGQDQKQQRFLQEGMQRILGILNGTFLMAKAVDRFELAVETFFGMTGTEFSNLMLSGVARLILWGDGRSRLPMVLHLFRSPRTGQYDYLFFATFSSATQGHRYIRDHLATLNRNRLGLRFFARSKVQAVNRSFTESSPQKTQTSFLLHPTIQYPDDIRLPKLVLRFVQALGPLLTVTPEPVRIRGRPYLAMGCVGREIEQFAFFALYPYARIQARLSSFRWGLVAFAVLNILFTILLGQAMSRRFLEPIGILSDGTQAIRRREFTRRLPDLGQDEFGRIGQAINGAMEGLEELAVARIVQENLLPSGALATRTFQVYGRSVPLSELGGDFFDFISTTDQRFVVAIGDVTGHGVPAALVMAMAKAVLFRSVHRGDSAVMALESLHRLFHQMRGRHSRRAMSLQVVEADDEKSEVMITNAGHCYAIHLSGQEGTLVKSSSTPVGISQRLRLGSVAVRMDPGDALVLYTDGAIELTNTADQPLGFEGLVKLARRCYDPDPMHFYERMYLALQEFNGNRVQAQDDLTILIVMRQEAGKTA